LGLNLPFQIPGTAISVPIWELYSSKRTVIIQKSYIWESLNPPCGKRRGTEAMIGDEQATVDKLADRYGLTSAEADLASAFLREASLRGAAEHRGLTLGTARQYLKRIFRKTGTNSQAKLMKVLLLTLLDHASAGCDSTC
jgi:DNA-binding CsgD family transcriptional regulator